MADDKAVVAAGSVDIAATLNMLTSVGIQGAECLSEGELKSLGDLTLNELRGLAKAQQLLPSGGGVCGGKIF